MFGRTRPENGNYITYEENKVLRTGCEIWNSSASPRRKTRHSIVDLRYCSQDRVMIHPDCWTEKRIVIYPLYRTGINERGIISIFDINQRKKLPTQWVA